MFFCLLPLPYLQGDFNRQAFSPVMLRPLSSNPHWWRVMDLISPAEFVHLTSHIISFQIKQKATELCHVESPGSQGGNITATRSSPHPVLFLSRLLIWAVLLILRCGFLFSLSNELFMQATWISGVIQCSLEIPLWKTERTMSLRNRIKIERVVFYGECV